jgi:DNA-binding winged helix-turn-helix (wHTH) protein
MLSFPPFQLDLDSERLWKNGEEARLRRKPFAILRHLVQHPQRVVTHGELVEAVWGKIAMSESLLRTHLCDLRHVLGEGVVETVVGRGYRFGPQVKLLQPEMAQNDVIEAPTNESGKVVVGRERELGALFAALRSAKGGGRSTVFVTGQAGSGKTTLIDVFLESAGACEQALVGYGACVEPFGTSEAYLPVLNAIGALCRESCGDRVIDVFARHAPAWLVQLPGFVSPERFHDLQRHAAGATQARLICELAEALEVLSVDAPVVLVLEDLHWSDPSTAELLAFLGRRRKPARLLIVGTYRPEEAARGHPLARAAGELIAHRHASWITLRGLDSDALGAYLARRYPGHAFPSQLADELEQSTGGNALFATTLVDELEAQGLLREHHGQWELSSTVHHVTTVRPDSIRRFIDAQIDRLSALQQRIIEIGGIAGMTFTAGVVAHALDTDADSVDSACELLASEHGLLQCAGTESWPDGTVESRYVFRHALVQDAARARSTATTARQCLGKLASCQRLRNQGESATSERFCYDCSQEPADEQEARKKAGPLQRRSRDASAEDATEAGVREAPEGGTRSIEEEEAAIGRLCVAHRRRHQQADPRKELRNQ